MIRSVGWDLIWKRGYQVGNTLHERLLTGGFGRAAGLTRRRPPAVCEDHPGVALTLLRPQEWSAFPSRKYGLRIIEWELRDPAQSTHPGSFGCRYPLRASVGSTEASLPPNDFGVRNRR